MTAVFKAFQSTDIGNREENQDSMLLLQKHDGAGSYIFLASVADGAGGFGDGKRASKTLHRGIYEWFSLTPASVFLESQGQLMNMLDAKIKEIHAKMVEEAKEDGISYGTTLTLFLLLEDKKYIAAQVGDSRLYIHENGRLTQITKDQTVAQKERDTGKVINCATDKESTLLQCIGAGTVAPKYYEGTISDKAQILLCSDGQTNRLSNREIQEVLETNREGDEKLQILLRFARNKLESDNITTLLITKE